MAGLAIVMEELFLLRKLALEMAFNVFTTQLPFLVGEFHFSAVCGCLDPLFVWHVRISAGTPLLGVAKIRLWARNCNTPC
jgi:hypothetical protein